MFIDNLKNEMNFKVTENGALGYATTGKNLLDLNFKVASLRGKSNNQIEVEFKKAWFENKELALKWLFFVRDIRGGLGERNLFRVALKSIADELDERVFDWIAEYGRYDDLFALFNTKLETQLFDYLKTQLKNDFINKLNNKPISLLAKWMPSENTSSKETVKLAKKIITTFKISSKEYRKTLVDLRKYIDIVESKMSAKHWEEIKYEAVPSRANLIYNNAFLRNDEERRREYLAKLEKGETKINSSVLFPHDIAQKYVKYSRDVNAKDIAIEAMWKGLPNYINNDNKTIVVVDGSGSMESTIGSTNVTALIVANSLAIYFAEKLEGQFKDKLITFSQTPQLVDFSNYNTLRDKLQLVFKYDEVANTNIEAVFDLILKTAINAKMEQNQIPQNILIISDMEFDSCATSNYKQRVNKKLFEVISQKYINAGYKLPRLVFWNVSSRTGTIPVIENDLGVALVSGFSPVISKMVLSNKIDPFEVLLETLLSERYKQITLKKE